MKRSQSSFIATEANFTKCIGISLLLWLIVVIIFVSRNGGNASNYNLPFTKNNIPNNQKQSNLNLANANPESLSYAQSLSAELTENGWKPIYIHSWSARMPIEEMDYLLEKYWYPNIKTGNEQQQQEEHQTVEDIDIKSLKKKKSRMMIEHEENEKNPEKLRNAPSTSSSRSKGITYPSDWTSPCYPANIHDEECILNQMKYWSKGVKTVTSKAEIKNKYVTFLRDCGGWNNIRQGFEFHAMVAWVTQRTLVLPPDMPWYLIDNGQMTRGTEERENRPAWPDNKDRKFGVSNYDIWFDMDDMSLVIPTITASEFIRREFESLSMPLEFEGGDIVNLDRSKASEYQKWLNQKATDLNVNLPWGPLANILYWPDVESVESRNSKQINRAWVDNREKREYTSFLEAAKFIHFPACAKGQPGHDHDYRYLGQIARAIAFDSREMDKKYKQILRDHIHLNSEIMEYASLVVSILGAYNYASFHIRRNELQYRYVFKEAPESYANVKPLIGDMEVLYIATDEKKDDFFKVFEDNGKRKVYRWKDFFGPQAQFEQTKNIKIPGKLHGEVEMAICAMGRIFFGTKESTFSQYIGELRGYFNAPYTQTLYHHYKLTKDVDESSKISKSNPSKPYNGQIYKIPFPDLWEDIKDMP